MLGVGSSVSILIVLLEGPSNLAIQTLKCKCNMVHLAHLNISHPVFLSAYWYMLFQLSFVNHFFDI